MISQYYWVYGSDLLCPKKHIWHQSHAFETTLDTNSALTDASRTRHIPHSAFPPSGESDRHARLVSSDSGCRGLLPD